MEKTVWKFPVADYKNTIVVPKGAQILSAQTQGAKDDIFVWMLVDPDTQDRETIFIFACSTGGYVPDSAIHFIDTVQQGGGTYVLHLFATDPSPCWPVNPASTDQE